MTLSRTSLASMTGFARCEGGLEARRWVLEVRSVNGRTLEVKYRAPQGFEAVERFGRDIAKSRFTRGQMNLTLTVASTASKTGLSLNHDALNFYLDASHELIEAGKAMTPSADGLLALRGVIDTSGDDRTDLSEAEEAALSKDIERLFDLLKAARDREGQSLETILNGHLAAMAAALVKAKTLADQQVEVIKERFVRRLNEIMPDGAREDGFDERVLQEAAMLATRADVREELDRLSAHIDQAHGLINEEAAPGRKLDFLAQEFMREANTLCSKSAFIELTQVGLELKAVIDQFREQTQNVE